MAVRVLTLLLLAAAAVSAKKTQIDCDLVRCARPLCEDGVTLVTPLGKCCPICNYPTTTEPEEDYGDEETKPVSHPNPESDLDDDYDYDPEESESSSHSKPDKSDPDDGSTDLLDCPGDQPVSLCKTDPCDVNTCPAYPNARCKANFCGGCNARFFVGDKEVTGDCGKPASSGSGSGVAKPETLCSVEGEVWSECGGACPPTCLAPYIICLVQGCFPGCTCPEGQLRDEVNNRCVPLEQCPPPEPFKPKPTEPDVPTPVAPITDPLACPPDVPVATCFVNPCDFATCLTHPDARCLADFCGGCRARFFDGTNEITESCDPCALVDCAPGHWCEVYTPTSEAVCQPDCDLDNGGCPPDQRCRLRQPQCIRAPCPRLVECVGGDTNEPTKPSEATGPNEPEFPDKPKPTDATDETYVTKPPESATPQATSTPNPNATCPPTCSMAFCSQKGNRRALCTAPGPRDIPGCTGQCQLTYCHACYHSATSVDIPGSCGQCEQYTAESSCFKAWAKCVRKAQNDEHGKLAKRLRTESNFQCHRPPCDLRG